MMNNEHPLEHEIIRSLDGVLNDEQQLELDRAILKDPVAHRLRERYGHIDELASQALNAAVADQGPAFDPMQMAAGFRPAQRNGYHWAWWMLPGALAAALVLAVYFQPTVDRLPSSQSSFTNDGVYRRPADVPKVGGYSDTPAQYSYVGDWPREIKRQTDRQSIGVLGKDGRIYWIEVDRIRTFKAPKAREGVRPAFGDL